MLRMTKLKTQESIQRNGKVWETVVDEVDWTYFVTCREANCPLKIKIEAQTVLVRSIIACKQTLVNVTACKVLCSSF
jgi:hypothetical protein